MKPGDLITAPNGEGPLSIWNEPPKLLSGRWSFERAFRNSADEGSVGMVLDYVDMNDSVDLINIVDDDLFTTSSLKLFYAKVIMNGVVGYTWAHFIERLE